MFFIVLRVEIFFVMLRHKVSIWTGSVNFWFTDIISRFSYLIDLKLDIDKLQVKFHFEWVYD